MKGKEVIELTMKPHQSGVIVDNDFLLWVNGLKQKSPEYQHRDIMKLTGSNLDARVDIKKFI